MYESHSKIYVNLRPVASVRTNNPVQVMSLEKVQEKGRVVSVMKWKTDNPSLRYKGLKFEDFYIENLEDADVKLSFAQLSKSSFEIVDNLNAA